MEESGKEIIALPGTAASCAEVPAGVAGTVRTCRMVAGAVGSDSMKAIFVPSSDITGDVLTTPAGEVETLYENKNVGEVPHSDGRTGSLYRWLKAMRLACPIGPVAPTTLRPKTA